MSEMNREPERRNTRAWQKLGHFLLLVLGGIALNLILSQAVLMLSLPMYLDSIGTILVSMIGGFVPGIVVGYATNLLKTLFDPISIYYCAINVLIAVVAALLQRKRWFTGWGKTLCPCRCSP